MFIAKQTIKKRLFDPTVKGPNLKNSQNFQKKTLYMGLYRTSYIYLSKNTVQNSYTVTETKTRRRCIYMYLNNIYIHY